MPCSGKYCLSGVSLTNAVFNSKHSLLNVLVASEYVWASQVLVGGLCWPPAAFVRLACLAVSSVGCLHLALQGFEADCTSQEYLVVVIRGPELSVVVLGFFSSARGYGGTFQHQVFLRCMISGHAFRSPTLYATFSHQDAVVSCAQHHLSRGVWDLLLYGHSTTSVSVDVQWASLVLQLVCGLAAGEAGLLLGVESSFSGSSDAGQGLTRFLVWAYFGSQESPSTGRCELEVLCGGVALLSSRQIRLFHLPCCFRDW